VVWTLKDPENIEAFETALAEAGIPASQIIRLHGVQQLFDYIEKLLE
jgi:hypothetical protein